MERRRGAQSNASPLPNDYLKMVEEVFSTNFDSGLKALTERMEGKPRFEVTGAIYGDEIVLCVSLTEEEQLAATTVYASIDFDPKASAPTAQDLLSSCVDAIGALFGQLFSSEHPERLDQIASHTLSSLDNIPFHWSEVRIDRQRIYMKVDKSNPRLDRIADEWINKHDPRAKERDEEEQRETEKLFVTGESSKKSSGRGSAGGTLH